MDWNIAGFIVALVRLAHDHLVVLLALAHRNGDLPFPWLLRSCPNIRDQVLRPAARFLPCKKRDAGLNNLQHLVRASILSYASGSIFRRLEMGFELLSMDWKITGFIVVLVRLAHPLGRSPSACASPW